jgi:hypothetical protein
MVGTNKYYRCGSIRIIHKNKRWRDHSLVCRKSHGRLGKLCAKKISSTLVKLTLMPLKVTSLRGTLNRRFGTAVVILIGIAFGEPIGIISGHMMMCVTKDFCRHSNSRRVGSISHLRKKYIANVFIPCSFLLLAPYLHNHYSTKYFSL